MKISSGGHDERTGIHPGLAARQQHRCIESSCQTKPDLVGAAPGVEGTQVNENRDPFAGASRPAKSQNPISSLKERRAQNRGFLAKSPTRPPACPTRPRYWEACGGEPKMFIVFGGMRIKRCIGMQERSIQNMWAPRSQEYRVGTVECAGGKVTFD